MRRSVTAIAVALGVVFVLLLSSIFVVDEREKALVLQFGQIKQVREEPGIGFKIPFIQEVVKYDDRILSLDTDTIEVTPSDDRRLVVDAFTRYRIEDPVRFRQAVGAGGVATAQDRLGSILNAQIRQVLGADQVTSDTILSEERRSLMNRIRDNAQAEAEDLGIDVVDVRLKQTNLPEQNLAATFDRMRAEREREAADEIARGNEAAQRVRATADRTVSETLSEADRDAEITRGEADAEANRTFAEAYGADPEFFQFYRSMQAYERALQGSNSTLVLTPDNSFFDYLYDNGGTGAGAASNTLSTTPGTAPAAAPALAEEEAALDGAAGEATAEEAPTDAAPTGAATTDAATTGGTTTDGAAEAGPALTPDAGPAAAPADAGTALAAEEPAGATGTSGTP